MAGGAAEFKFSSGRIVTDGVKKMAVLVPISVGDPMNCYIQIVSTGRSPIVTRIEPWIRRREGSHQIKCQRGRVRFAKVGSDKRLVPAGSITPTNGTSSHPAVRFTARRYCCTCAKSSSRSLAHYRTIGSRAASSAPWILSTTRSMVMAVKS